MPTRMAWFYLQSIVASSPLSPSLWLWPPLLPLLLPLVPVLGCIPASLLLAAVPLLRSSGSVLPSGLFRADELACGCSVLLCVDVDGVA